MLLFLLSLKWAEEAYMHTHLFKLIIAESNTFLLYFGHMLASMLAVCMRRYFMFICRLTISVLYPYLMFYLEIILLPLDLPLKPSCLIFI